MYIRFDLEDHVDLALIRVRVCAWALTHDMEYTEKTIWNKRQQHHRVCLPTPSDYSLFALTWPETSPKFVIVTP